MVTAIVSLKVARNRVSAVASEIAGIVGVSEVYSVTGRFDLFAIVRTTSIDEVAGIVADKLLKVDGILDSETNLAFRAYSKHDLDAMFSIGAE